MGRFEASIVVGILFVVGCVLAATFGQAHPHRTPVIVVPPDDEVLAVRLFESDECPACRKLDIELRDGNVVGEMRRLGYYPNIERYKAGNQERYIIAATPTLLIVRADGTEVDRLVGWYPSKKIVEWLRAHRKPK